MFCALCNARIQKMHFAIRDMKPVEGYFEWLVRHILCVLTFGHSRKRAVIIPICDSCAKAHIVYNIVMPKLEVSSKPESATLSR